MSRRSRASEQVSDRILLLRASELAMAAALGLVLIATLAPFELVWPSRFALDLELRVSDVLLNLCMLAPLGFLLRLRFGVSAWAALLLGALLSGSLEGAQMFVPTRCPSAIDVLTNALGCLAGQRIHALTAPWSERVLLRLLRQPPSFEDSVWLGLVLLVVALAPLELGLGPSAGLSAWSVTSFSWTLGLAPIAADPQARVLGLLGSLCVAAWLGYTLGDRRSLTSIAYVVLVPSAIELCRGFSSVHVASLASLLLAVACAHVASRVRHAQRVWV